MWTVRETWFQPLSLPTTLPVYDEWHAAICWQGPFPHQRLQYADGRHQFKACLDFQAQLHGFCAGTQPPSILPAKQVSRNPECHADF